MKFNEILKWAVEGAYYTWKVKREIAQEYPNSRVLGTEESEAWDRYLILLEMLKKYK